MPPPTYVRAVGFQGRIDRAQMFEFIAPGSIVQLSAADEAGRLREWPTVSNSKLRFRLFHGLTPETDTSCFYFWSTANGFRTERSGRDRAVVQRDRRRVPGGPDRRGRPAGAADANSAKPGWSTSPPMPRGCTCAAPCERLMDEDSRALAAE